MTELLENNPTPQKTLSPFPQPHQGGPWGARLQPSPGCNEVPNIPTGVTSEKAKEGAGISSLLAPHPEVRVETTRRFWTSSPTWQ